MDPPQCVQNAMMTKDKKPFTYTPGGIDLSEVRSPRMQRRIERNANLGGAGDYPQPPQQSPPQNFGPLPPSALAALRPQTQVQVFPGPPPPPQMSRCIPPPPPPPSGPLPTQKVVTGDNQVLERPDMTKIIPDNPMAMLRKTGGPAPRKSIVEQYNDEEVLPRQPPAPPQRNIETQSPKYQPTPPPSVIERPTPVSTLQPQQRQSQIYQSAPVPPQQQQQYQPPPLVVERAAPVSQQQQQRQSQIYQTAPVPPQQQQCSPPLQQNQFASSPATQQQFQQQTGYNPPVIERQTTLPRQQKNVSSNIGTLYIPPLQQQQQKVGSPPISPPEQQQHHSPGTPTTLKEGPRPWQRNQQQQELPPWAKKEELAEQINQPQVSPSPLVNKPQNRWQPSSSAISPTLSQQQQRQQQQPVRQNQPGSQFSPRPDQIQQQSFQPRSPQTNNPQNSFPVRIEIRTGGYQPSSSDEEFSSRNPNAVYITQPIVLQHPGGGPVGQRIDPPYKAPTQQTAQSPQFQQQQIRQQQQTNTRVETTGTRIIPIQVEGGNSPGGERTLNRQQSWGNNNSNQPPQSNTFKIIQKYTKTDDDDDEDDKTPITKHSPRYTQKMPEQMRRMRINNDNNNNNGHLFRPGGPQQNNTQPQTQRNGNGNGGPQAVYIHPSEQVVPEPKKYMGSNIPSRSFKILQAMTAPSENSANANNNNEEYSPYNNHHRPFTPYSFPFFPPAHPSFWPDYYNNYYRQEEEEEEEQSESIKTGKSGRGTPLIPVPVPPPYWACFPPHFPRKPENPPPNWSESSNDYQKLEEFYSSIYPPYFFHYYYGFPQFMPPHYSTAYYPTAGSETQEYSGYSTTDELTNLRPRRNSLDNINSSSTTNKVQNLTQHFEIHAKSATPRITITHTSEESEEKPSSSDLCRLKSIKSVQNLNIYATKDDLLTTTDTDDVDEDDADDDESSTEESSDEITEEDDETYSEDQHCEEIPHQLSVIYEESADERTESRRSFRCNSASNETIAENPSDKEDDFLCQQSVEYKIKLFQQQSTNLEEKFILMDDDGATSAKLLTTTTTEKELKSEENWWDVVREETSSENVEIVKVSQNRTVQVDMGDQIVTVKLRNKPGRTNRNSDEENNDAFFNCAPQRSSIYEILNNDEDDQEPNNIIASGSLMKVDSFASQLEAIKRNSGLFDFVNNNNKVDDGSTEKIIAEEEKCIISEAENNNEEIDFWSQIKSDEDDFIPRRSSYFIEEIPENENDKETEEEHHNIPNNEATDKSESSVDENNEDENAKNTETINANSLEPQTIKDRIEALKNSIAEKQKSIPKLIETQTSAKSSIKSFDTEDSEEEEEEEELDSGVISDISRHISDSEEFPELKKLTKYERAATHSRLFKLLQDEDDIEEEDEEESSIKQEDKFSKLSVRKREAQINHQLTPSRSKLNLTLLNQCNNENNGQIINEKLVEELVQSLLKSKKSHIFKNMPKEKLYAAAVKILQEGIIDDCEETPEEFSSLGTESSTPAQTPQEFYGDNNEYKQYYETWSDAAVEIMPSKAFKLLQKHIGTNKLGSIDGIAKCPRVLSVKNVGKLLNNNDSDCCSSSSSSTTSAFSQIHIPQNPQTNDRTNT